ncbi:hypothetical protein, partial [Streptomyces carpinensis]|uniref:hypothetical protein n=1 Tax=Streptomyces carpinensis TaxID=66369 RepID=UPI001ABFD888
AGIRDARPQLADHARHGYRRVVRLMTGLPGRLAVELDQVTLLVLRLVGMEPVQGLEHFDVAALPVVQAAVEEWLRHNDAA